MDGQSFATSLQAQINYEPVERFDVKFAYRFYDVKTTYSGQLLQKPLVAKDRLFLNISYSTINKWAFDYTINWQGKKRIPDTKTNPVIYQRPEFSPDFMVMNAQISKNWQDKFEIYLGAENLLNYRQEDPIISNEDPFGPYFDSSLIWGPVFGRNVYMGLRYKIQ